MLKYKYLIIGGGMAADSAVQGIREVDTEGEIGLISAEPHPPYDRPPLSKALWKDGELKDIWRATESHTVDAHFGRTVSHIDRGRKTVTDDHRETYGYEKLLLATGARVRRLPFGEQEIITFRTVDDYLQLRQLAESGSAFAVIGGGFIGSEVAAALAMNDKEVFHVFPEEGICERIFPRDLADFLVEYFAEHGVTVLGGHMPIALANQSGYVLRVEHGDQTQEQELEVDGVVAGIGVQPNVELAQSIELTTDNGICVDEFLRTSDPDIFAAGDVAAYPDKALGTRRRVEHEDAANGQGRQAGRNMAGSTAPYEELPLFYSDLFDLGYEAVGDLDARLTTVADWTEPYREGVVYYLKDDRVRGVLLWNVWDQVDAARALIAEPGPFRPEDLKGRIPG